MEFHVQLTGRGDLAARIYRQLLDAILDGRLRSGERLPPTRELAERLDVSRNTVAVAYDRLTAEGFLVARVGAGTFVGAQALPPTRPRAAPVGDVAPRALWADVSAPAATVAPDHDFRVGIPDVRLFPLRTWRRLVTRELHGPALRTAGYDDAAGHAGLRAAIARHLGVSRSVNAAPADVLITHGAQQALDLVARVLIEPGGCVAVEEPGYPPARQLFSSLGARVIGVPVDADGLVVDALPADARLVHVTPSHQFPLGTAMSLARRTALLCWAERTGAAIIEDDYDSEYRFGGRPLEPLQSLDRCGRVVYIGTFSKTLLPKLRLGFLIAPASLQPALRAAKRLSDLHGDPVTQGAMAGLIDEGLLGRHIRRATRVYAARREAVLAGLREHLDGLLSPVPSAAGLHLCARLRPGVDVDLPRVVARAAEAGVGVESLADHCAATPPQEGLVLGYGAIDEDGVSEGLRRLAACFGR
ncbi:PLP-dependent aminotransferase family protein [Pseudonocardia sp. GCM10023141]|uniref:MocR-like pyridoxine biosynthesis transcription factor PdxR n=1 Tax=Pseudonocardia sp. GCM10023141 TaxID=3252653 RepID=UPI00360C7094